MLAVLRGKQFQRATPALRRADRVTRVRSGLRVRGKGREVFRVDESSAAGADEERRSEVGAALWAGARRKWRQLRRDRIRVLGAHTVPAPGIGGGGGRAFPPASA